MSRRWKRILLVAGALIGVFAIVAGSWAWRVANSFRDENTSFTQVIKSYTDPRSEFPNTSKLTLLSAAELLTSPLGSRVRECDSETCEWLFLDLSHGRTRRWCDMQTCGNRAKAKRYHTRKTAGAGHDD